MTDRHLRILLVEDDYDYVGLLKVLFKSHQAISFQITHADRLQIAISELERKAFDAIVLDLELPDCQGLETFRLLYSRFYQTPILILTASEDKNLAVQAVSEGAQDYLVKNSLEIGALARAVEFAIQRQQNLLRLQRESMVDELTGLLNRRGFFSIANQHIKIARRAMRPLLLFYLDLNSLKQINDGFGHHMGDQALTGLAAVLKATFRSSDVLARLGGDEFTVMAIDAGNGKGLSVEAILNRFNTHLAGYNAKMLTPAFQVSIGYTRIDPHDHLTLEEYLILADQSMYNQKPPRSS